MSLAETTFETARLVLEPLRREHAAEMFDMLSDARLYRFIPHDPPASAEAVAERFARLQTRGPSSGHKVWFNWVARSRADGRCLGRVEVTLREDGRAWLAYEIGPEYWRQGFATEACGRVIEALFDSGVGEVIAEVDTRNEASIRLLERLGFARGALKKDADTFKGSTSDEWTYRLARAGFAADRVARAGRIEPFGSA